MSRVWICPSPQLIVQPVMEALPRSEPSRYNVKVWPTPATFYSFWDVRGCFGLRTPDGSAILSDSDEVAGYLLREVGAIVGSGSGFLCDGYLRLCFAATPETIVDGLTAIRSALDALEPARLAV